MMTWRHCCCAGVGACLCPFIPCPPSTSPLPTPWHHPPCHSVVRMLLLSPCFPAFLGVFRWPGELVACPLIAHFVSIASPRLTPPTLPCLALPSCSLWLVQVAGELVACLHLTFMIPSCCLRFTFISPHSTSFHSPFTSLHFTQPHSTFISPSLHITSFHPTSLYYSSIHLTAFHLTYALLLS